MKVYSDDYYSVVAENLEQAKRFFLDQELTDEEALDEIREINPDKRKVWFPVNELPEQYHDQNKYPQQDWCGEYIGVELTLTEAMQYHTENPPYVISVSSDLV